MKKIIRFSFFTALLLSLSTVDLMAADSGYFYNQARTFDTQSVYLIAQADVSAATAASGTKTYDDDELVEDDYFPDDYDQEEFYAAIADPFEPVNRVFFHINDKLYFWGLKPAARGYSAVVPEPARRGVRNFFRNIAFPVRFINCIFQGKFEGAGHELGRFLVNSTLGVAGFMDRASKDFNIPVYDEDFGQTLASYGIGQGFFINWPFLGPSTALDTIGSAGDAFLEPMHYLDVKTKYDIAIKGIETINKTSLSIGEYEDLKDAALDHYIAVRNAYIQYRRSQIEK